LLVSNGQGTFENRVVAGQRLSPKKATEKMPSLADGVDN
jgi:hypothetical protein